MQENNGLSSGDGLRVPQPNVPTGALAVPVADPGTRPLGSIAGTGLSLVGQSQPMHQPCVVLPADYHVRTNEGFTNIQPSDSHGKSSLAFLPARRYASAGLCDSDVSVCLSVRLSHAGIVPSRAKAGS